MERLVTFIDVDENRLELWLKPDRVQLVVIDSRPELEAAELRRFASVVFAEYVARDLADRLDAARAGLEAARGRAHGPDPAPAGELAATLDAALRAIGELAAAIPAPGEPGQRDADADADAEGEGGDEAPSLDRALDPEPAAAAARAVPPGPQVTAGQRAYPSLQALLRGSPAPGEPAGKRPRRGRRAEEASAVRWGAGGLAVVAGPAG